VACQFFYRIGPIRGTRKRQDLERLARLLSYQEAASMSKVDNKAFAKFFFDGPKSSDGKTKSDNLWTCRKCQNDISCNVAASGKTNLMNHLIKCYRETKEEIQKMYDDEAHANQSSSGNAVSRRLGGKKRVSRESRGTVLASVSLASGGKRMGLSCGMFHCSVAPLLDAVRAFCALSFEHNFTFTNSDGACQARIT
jgi:hypothetical protein